MLQSNSHFPQNMFICRSSRQEVFSEKDVLINFAKFTGKHLCQSLFFEESLWRKCFPVNFVKFLRTPFLENASSAFTLMKALLK